MFAKEVFKTKMHSDVRSRLRLQPPLTPAIELTRMAHLCLAGSDDTHTIAHIFNTERLHGESEQLNREWATKNQQRIHFPIQCRIPPR